MAKIVELIETKPRMAIIVAKSVPNRPGIAGEFFSCLGNAGFNVEMISETSVSGNLADISFAVNEPHVEKIVKHLENCAGFEIAEFEVIRKRGLLTVYGKNLSREPGIAGKVFSLLAQEAINIDMISTSFTSITVLIKESYLAPARNLMMKEFELDA